MLETNMKETSNAHKKKSDKPTYIVNINTKKLIFKPLCNRNLNKTI